MKSFLNLKTAFLLLLLTTQGSELLAKRTAQILYFKAPKDAPKTAFIFQLGKEPLEVDLPRNNFSSSFPLADGDLILRFLGAPLNKGEVTPKSAPALKIKASFEKILILAFPDPENEVFPIKFEVINANDKTFGPGDRMFINSTGSHIAGLVGRKKLDLPSKSMKILKNIAQPMEEYQTRLDMLSPGQPKPVTFIRQVWRQSATRRSLIFIYSPPGSTRITYYCAPIRDL